MIVLRQFEVVELSHNNINAISVQRLRQLIGKQTYALDKCIQKDQKETGKHYSYVIDVIKNNTDNRADNYSILIIVDGDDNSHDSDSREAPEFSIFTADSAGDKLWKKSSSKSSARTSSLEKVRKKRKSKKDVLQAVYDKQLSKIENNFNVKLDRLFQLFAYSVDNDQSRESSALLMVTMWITSHLGE
ncbi:unnamed protein product [Mytilus edulis]|uniref:Uncharacterized protein n=1 Tax=Mytilus edulis TaxID=6550 RepID=A0A8S3RVN7_MYTED|nr:unnamed protein product [Mytilus edulis]